MANMYEFRCNTGACFAHWLVKEYEDPTSSSGCCKICGTKTWTLKETDLTEEEYFKQQLKDPFHLVWYKTDTHLTSFAQTKKQS